MSDSEKQTVTRWTIPLGDGSADVTLTHTGDPDGGELAFQGRITPSPDRTLAQNVERALRMLQEQAVNEIAWQGRAAPPT